MKGNLLDTNVVLISSLRSAELSPGVRRAIAEGPNFISVVVYWEVTLKSMKGKLNVGDPKVWWRDALDQLAATPVYVRPEHVSELQSLPPIHHDPFDRLLIEQAISEDLTLLTTHAQIPRYASIRFHTLGTVAPAAN